MLDPIGNVWRKVEVEPWRPWFAWHPITTKAGKRVWLEKVYRRCIWHYGDNVGAQHTTYEYANIFDILKQ